MFHSISSVNYPPPHPKRKKQTRICKLRYELWGIKIWRKKKQLNVLFLEILIYKYIYNWLYIICNRMFHSTCSVTRSCPTKRQTRLSDFTFTFHFHKLEKEMATYSSVLSWRIPGTVKPGGLLFMGLHRIGHDWSNLAAAAAYRNRLKHIYILSQEKHLSVSTNFLRTSVIILFVIVYSFCVIHLNFHVANLSEINFAWNKKWQPTPVVAWRIPWTEEAGGLQSMGF